MADLKELSSPPSSLDAIGLPSTLPPVLLIAFIRPDKLEQVLLALANQSLRPSRVIAYLDGPRNSEDATAINTSEALLRRFSREVPTTIVRREKNLGCDRNVIDAITTVFKDNQSLIYLEDDVVPNRCFYDRMTRLLTAYENYPRVFSVSGYSCLPVEYEDCLLTDFWVSDRVFALGLGLWVEKWRRLQLSEASLDINVFGEFYKIPATIQTKHTMVNQFFNEENQQTDWVIAMTLRTLQQGWVHVLPKVSFVRNIGFDDPGGVHYTGAEPSWLNARFNAESYPDKLPANFEVSEILRIRLSGAELVEHFRQTKQLWLTPKALLHLMRQSPDLYSKMVLMGFFFSRLLPLMRRRKYLRQQKRQSSSCRLST